MAGKERPFPLQSLVFFESAARHLNFTSAAHELGATQPAVSQRVREIEQDLNVVLFKRMHRGVSLTAEGARLFEAVHESLDAIRVVTAEIRTRGARKILTLTTDFGFAAYWLLPRLPRLRSLIPDLELRVITSQEDFDIRGEPVDFAVS